MKVPRKLFLSVALLVIAVAGGYLALDRWVWEERLPEGLIQANGRIEGDLISVASKFPGRIQQGSFFKGAGLEILWDSVLAMVLLGSAVFGFGMWRFRRQFE